MHSEAESEDGAAGWPNARPYDVVFYRSFGSRARVNVASQHLYDPRIFAQQRKFTHCALVSSGQTAIEAYPRAVKGRVTGTMHMPGVRFVPVADLCSGWGERYRDFAVLRAPGLGDDPVLLSAEATGMGWDMLRHRYGLRRFFGLRHRRFPGEPVAEPGTEWLSCADIVQKILFGSGRFGVRQREIVGPITLFSELKGLGWGEVTGEYEG